MAPSSYFSVLKTVGVCLGLVLMNFLPSAGRVLSVGIEHWHYHLCLRCVLRDSPGWPRGATRAFLCSICWRAPFSGVGLTRPRALFHLPEAQTEAQ
jgi:hypothetical protein